MKSTAPTGFAHLQEILGFVSPSRQVQLRAAAPEPSAPDHTPEGDRPMKGQTFLKRRDFVAEHTATSRTHTGIQSVADIAQVYPSLYAEIRAQAVQEERARVKLLNTTTPQDEKNDGETLMEAAAARAAARRK